MVVTVVATAFVGTGCATSTDQKARTVVSNDAPGYHTAAASSRTSNATNRGRRHASQTPTLAKAARKISPHRAAVDLSRPLTPRLKRNPKATRADHVVVVGDAAIFIDVDPDSSPAVATHAKVWCARSAEMLVRYFGQFSVPSLEIEVRNRGWGAVGFGQHYAGERLVIRAGDGTDIEDLKRDWVMTHEMFHTAFPSLDRKHRWMREGLSTYLESVVRTQAGVIGEAEVWRRWADRMPSGLPGPREGGLDHTRSWGSVYWGGTLFWLLVDVRIREETGNRLSLQDALATILREGGQARRVWPMKKVLRVGDRATGTRALSRTYAEMAASPYREDLDTLWTKLGVRVRGSEVSYDDGAPLAHIRRALLAKKYDLNALLPVR